MTKKYLSATLLVFFFAFAVSAQTPGISHPTSAPNLLEKIELKFNLTGMPTPEEVGFDNRKSSWKLKYELLLSDEKTIAALTSKAYVNCKDSDATYQKCVTKTNKKLDREYRKVALFVSRAAFVKNTLLSSAEREILVPVNFSPDVIRVFNEAAAQSAANPVFLLQIKSKVTGKTSTGEKIKYKTTTRFQYPLKFIRSDGSYEFYNITIFGASVGIDRKPDGGFSYSIYRN